MDSDVRPCAGRGAIAGSPFCHRASRDVPGAIHGSLILVFLITPLFAFPLTAQERDEPTQGFINLSVSTRTFDAPLFGEDSRTSFRLFGRQAFDDGSVLAAWGYGGFPNTTSLFGIEWDRVPFRSGLLQAVAGDFSIRPVEPEGVSTSIGDAFPVEGASIRFEGGRRRWSLFAGRSKYRIALPGAEVRRPVLAGGDYLLRTGRNHLGAGLMVVDEPAYAAGQQVHDSDAIATGRYIREVSPWTNVFSEAYASMESALGFRAGANLRFQNGQVNTAVYSFDGGFPFVPLVRPGEEGIELSGSYKPSELSTLSGQLYYVNEDVIADRSNLRGYAAYGRNFVGGPSVHVSYGRDELTFETLEGRTSRIADRAALSLTRAHQTNYTNLRLEHVMNADGGEPDRTQAVATLLRTLREDSFLDFSLVAQAENSASYGVTAEAAYESSLRGPWRYLVGIGGAWLDRGAESGEGLVRVGLSRRLGGDGIYGRIEARIPFDIGLPRSNLNRNTVAVDIGARYGWEDMKDIQSIFMPIVRPSLFGSIEGTVTIDGRGVGGLPIFLDGRRAATTGGDGVYRITRVPVGAASISIAPTSLEPGYLVVGGFSRTVQVLPREAIRADFELARFSTFQGSVVYCADGRIRPAGGARIALISADEVFTLTTSSAGGFNADDIPPGEYDVVIDADSVAEYVTPDQIPVIRLDLGKDVAGYVIRLGCPPV